MGTARRGVPILDHVAVRVDARDATAAALCERLPLDVLERKDAATIVGDRAGGWRIVLMDQWPGDDAADCADLESFTCRPGPGRTDVPVILPNGVVVTFADDDPGDARLQRGVLEGATIAVPDPVVLAAWFDAELGCEVPVAQRDVAVVRLGSESVTLVRLPIGDDMRSAEPEVPVDRLAFRVADLDAWTDDDAASDLPRSVLLTAPGGLRIELVEQTAPLVAR